MKITEQFQPGDIVVLKSGGPNMTVNIFDKQGSIEGKYHCQWFSGATLKYGYFRHESLRKVMNVADSLNI